MSSEQNESKAGEMATQDGQYQCVVCGHVMELKSGQAFEVCPVCHAGSPGGPKGAEEGVWVYTN